MQCLIALTVILSNIFTLCFFGDSVTHKFDELNDCIYASLWYKYPLDVQKSMILVLARTQQPFFFAGYFISSCSLERFKDVRDLLIFIYQFNFVVEKMRIIIDILVADSSSCISIFYGAPCQRIDLSNWINTRKGYLFTGSASCKKFCFSKYSPVQVVNIFLDTTNNKA